MKFVKESKNQSSNDNTYIEQLEAFWHTNPLAAAEKLESFTKFVSRQSLTKFLARAEIFQKQLLVNGSIVEVGVHRGTSFMTWAHLSSIYEPVNYLRKIIGFDTFEGFPSVHANDLLGKSEHLKDGGFAVEKSAYDSLKAAIDLWDTNRLMNHIPKCELVVGNACKTIPEYLEENSHVLISLLHLDADLYEPTKIALSNFVPRMPKGAIILFDELNMDLFPGETLACLEELDINTKEVKRFSYATSMSYLVI